LFAAALVLMAVNGFVMNAVSQCFRELETDWSHFVSINEKDVETCESEDSIEASKSLVLVPVPVLFTDRFRWLLQQKVATHQTPGIIESESSKTHEVLEARELSHGHGCCLYRQFWLGWRPSWLTIVDLHILKIETFFPNFSFDYWKTFIISLFNVSLVYFSNNIVLRKHRGKFYVVTSKTN
jgi:hypothetical protein